MIKRLLSFFIALTVVLGLFTINVSAQDDMTPQLYLTITDNSDNEIDSVNSGSNIKLNIQLDNYQYSINNNNQQIVIGAVYINFDGSYFELVDDSFSNPYNQNMIINGNITDNLLILLFESDNGVGDTFSISKDDLDKTNGLLFSLELTAKKTLTNKLCEFSLSDKSNIALKDFTYLELNCSQKNATVNYNNIYTPKQTTGLKAANASFNSVDISWKKVSGVTGYELYGSSNKKSWKHIAILKGASAVKYTQKSLTVGKTYYYFVRSYKIVDGVTLYGPDSSVISNKQMPVKVTGVKAVSAGYNSTKITFTKSSGVTGYVLYASADKKNWKKVATLKGADKTSYTHKSLTSGKTYYYLVRSYKSSGGKNYYSPNSSVVSVKPVPNKETITYLKNTDKKTITIKWKKQSGVSGYEIYYAKSKNSKYTRLKNVSGATNISYKKSSLTKGKTYYFKVRAYKTVKGKKVYGAFSNYKYVKVTK